MDPFRHAAGMSALTWTFAAAFGSSAALAETPGEIPKPWTYDGSMKLQEQQRQQGPGSSAPAQPGAAPGAAMGNAAAAENVRRSWQNRPPLPPDRNPILGKWNPQGSAPFAKRAAGGQNDVAALLGGMLGGACDSMFGRGVIEFRPKTLVAISKDGSESVLNHVEYRSDGTRVAVLPQDPGSIGVLVFEFEGKERIHAEGLGCVMGRPGAAAARTQAAASPPRSPAPSSTGATAVEPSTAKSAGAVLSLSVAWSAPGSTTVANRKLWVLRNDPQVALIKGGLRSSPDGNVVKNWMRACLGHKPACQQGMQALNPYSVGFATTDASGHAQTPPLPIGRYWVLADSKVDDRRIVWQQPVDLKPGGIAVVLDQRNAMPLD